MGDLSPVVNYEEIDWPKEYVPLESISGSHQIGHCWKVDCIREELIDSLMLELNKKRKILSHLERRMHNVQDDLKFAESGEEDDENDHDIEGEISQLDILITKTRNRIEDIEKQLSLLRSQYDDSDDESVNKGRYSCFAKLLLNPYIIRNNSCINEKHRSQNVEYQLDTLLNEVEDIKSVMERYWVDMDIDKKEYEGALTIVTVAKILRKKKPFIDTWCLLYVTPEMENGSVESYLRDLPNRFDTYQLEDELLQRNLRQHITLLTYMENNKIAHNNIKLSNVLISQDGLKLLLSDFCPKTLFIERCYKVNQGKLNLQPFVSPELTLLLVNRVPFHSPELSNEIITGVDSFQHLDFAERIEHFLNKNDVFCLGLVYYYLLTLTVPQKDEQLVYRDIINNLEKLRDTRDPDLINTVLRMLAFDPSTRPSWAELLDDIN